MSIRLYRDILRELKKVYPKQPLHQVPLVSYISDQFRRHNVTSQKICKSSTEMEQLGYSYLCLLNSARRTQELTEHYKGHGERSTESSAQLVGLKLPPPAE